jgi:hypothetical protein
MGMRHTFQSNRILVKEDFDKVDKEKRFIRYAEFDLLDKEGQIMISIEHW